MRKLRRIRRRTRRIWKPMSDEEVIQYGKDNGLFGLGPTEASDIDNGYYDVVRKRELIDTVFKRTTMNWKPMTDEEIIQYGKDNGLFGLGAGDLYKIEGGQSYYDVVRNRGLDDTVFKRKNTNWEAMTDEEVIQYGKDNGLFGLGPREASDRNSEYYKIVRNRGLDDTAFKRKRSVRMDWEAMTDEEVIQYGKDNGLFGLGPSEADDISSCYYRAVRKKGLISIVFKRKNHWSKDTTKFIEDDERARGIALLATRNGYTDDAIRLLTKLWPNRFPSYDKLAREMPKLVQKIGSVLGPITFTGLVEGVYVGKVEIPENVNMDLSEVLVRIGIEEYQPKFNKNPKDMLDEINAQEKHEYEGVRDIFKRVGEYYRDALKFKIPGYGSLKERA